LIAGAGAATLNAGLQDDILFAGWTDYDISSSGMTYDQKLAAVHAIIAEWGSADSYAARLSALSGYLNTNTVHDNYVSGVAVVDQLYGKRNANDWFFAGVNDHLSRYPTDGGLLHSFNTAVDVADARCAEASDRRFGRSARSALPNGQTQPPAGLGELHIRDGLPALPVACSG
jgi:hypothetical protein